MKYLIAIILLIITFIFLLALGGLVWGSITYIIALLATIAFNTPEITMLQAYIIGLVITIIAMIFKIKIKNV